MYIPSSFQQSDLPTLHDFLRNHDFAALITHGPAGMVASHLPLLLDADAGPRGQLVGHLARANPQWRSVAGEVLAVFAGPHTYVSPTWYANPGTVPTWNYVAVHVYGTLELVEDRAGLLAILRDSVAFHETGMPDPWSFDEADPAIETMLKAIIGFRITIDRIEGKWKLNQNHPTDRRQRVIHVLKQQPDDNSQAIAHLMSRTLEP